jgi:hypothetical protein
MKLPMSTAVANILANHSNSVRVMAVSNSRAYSNMNLENKNSFYPIPLVLFSFFLFELLNMMVKYLYHKPFTY